ncbi:aldehyde dehydrogenase [Linderina pennispora]|uniref:Aldehyde dehydrogenase n=1 Tax=Linderina pennispora TaxID=61395 RepID=A0A1Y1WLL2_9FUNG|nr:aldehyde dehydrogenase [Linderina pennispora]ORX74459.1 aldehyde dehydrogenase [Linderina pennispora]
MSDTIVTYTPIDAISTTVQDMRSSFKKGTMRDISFRKQQLKALMAGLRAHEKLIADAITADFGRAPQESIFYDILPVQFEIGQALLNMDKWAQPDKPALVRKEPLGTVVIIGPWNYPIRLILLPLIGALAAGNTVVLKPSELAPNSARAIENLVTDCLDPEVVRVVHGGVAETTELLKQRFEHYFYTGNGMVGKIVAKAAAEHLAGVTLELGGKSPVIVHEDVSDLGPAATRIMWGKLVNAGQTCVGVDYVLVHRSVKDRLIELFLNYIENAYGRLPQKSADYPRIINDRHWQRIMALVNSTKGTVLHTCDDQPDQNDRYIPPTIVDNVSFDDPLMSDELFAPVLPIITYDSLDEALGYVNSHDQPLALYSFGSDKSNEYVFANTRSGGALANDTVFHLAAGNFPFGGTGPSGVGRYMGKYSFDTFSHHRSVLKKAIAFPPPSVDSLRFPPYQGEENAWKPKGFGLLLTMVPLWRLMVSVGPLLRGMAKGRDMAAKPASKQ